MMAMCCVHALLGVNVTLRVFMLQASDSLKVNDGKDKNKKTWELRRMGSRGY